jgi:hypothetical protein
MFALVHCAIFLGLLAITSALLRWRTLASPIHVEPRNSNELRLVHATQNGHSSKGTKLNSRFTPWAKVSNRAWRANRWLWPLCGNQYVSRNTKIIVQLANHR